MNRWLPKLDASLPRLTREGFYFAGVLLFVISGAVAKQLNLLIVLCGLLLGPLVLHLRLVSTTLRSVRVSRRVPQRVFAGEPAYVQVGVENQRRHVPSWLLVVRDDVRLEDDYGRPATTRVELRVPFVGARQQVWTSYRLCLARRGRYVLGPMRITTSFPLGLFIASRRQHDCDSLLVVPRLGRLTQRWTQVLLGDESGSHQSYSRQGLTEADFYGLREWRSGDSRRWVHWRTSARLDTLAVRQFERQRQARVQLLVDLWLPPHPTDEQLVALEHAVSFAATAVQQLARDGNVQLALVLAGAEIEAWKGKVGSALCNDILDRLAVVRGTDASPEAGLERLNALVLPQGRRVVISSRPGPQWASVSNPYGNSGAGSPENVVWIDAGSPECGQYFQFELNSALGNGYGQNPANTPASSAAGAEVKGDGQ